MADEKGNPSNPTDEKQKEPVQTDKPENAIPYARFKEINDRAKELEVKLKQREDEDRQKQEAELVGQKKFQELLKQRDAELETEKAANKALEKKAQVFEEQQRALRDGLLSKITDPKLKAIAEELSIAKLQEFTESINTDKGSPFSAKGQSTGSKSDFERRDGETWPQYQARMQKLRASKRK